MVRQICNVEAGSIFQHLRGGGFTHPQRAALILEELLKLLLHPARVTP